MAKADARFGGEFRSTVESLRSLFVGFKILAVFVVKIRDDQISQFMFAGGFENLGKGTHALFFRMQKRIPGEVRGVHSHAQVFGPFDHVDGLGRKAIGLDLSVADFGNLCQGSF